MITRANRLPVMTVTRLKSFARCPRHHDFQYVQLRRPIEQPHPLRFGSAWHDGVLDPRWRRLGPPPEERVAPLAFAVAKQRLSAYDAAALEVMSAAYYTRWHDDFDKYEVLAVERDFLIDLETEHGVVRVGGKVDAIVRRRSDGTVWAVESKSTSEDITPDAKYWDRIRLDSQVSIYLLAAGTIVNEPITGMIYDVVRKPDAPKYATPPEKRKFTQGKGCKLCGGKAGVQGSGRRTADCEACAGPECATCGGTGKLPCAACTETPGWKEAPRLHANQREVDETVDAYRERIIDEYAEAPNDYVRRQEIQRLDSELDAGANDAVVSTLLMAQTMAIGYAPRNPGACHLFGRTCEYAQVCRGEALITDDSRFRSSSAFEDLPFNPEGHEGQAA